MADTAVHTRINQRSCALDRMADTAAHTRINQRWVGPILFTRGGTLTNAILDLAPSKPAVVERS